MQWDSSGSGFETTIQNAKRLLAPSGVYIVCMIYIHTYICHFFLVNGMHIPVQFEPTHQNARVQIVLHLLPVLFYSQLFSGR